MGIQSVTLFSLPRSNSSLKTTQNSCKSLWSCLFPERLNFAHLKKIIKDLSVCYNISFGSSHHSNVVLARQLIICKQWELMSFFTQEILQINYNSRNILKDKNTHMFLFFLFNEFALCPNNFWKNYSVISSKKHLH